MCCYRSDRKFQAIDYYMGESIASETKTSKRSKMPKRTENVRNREREREAGGYVSLDMHRSNLNTPVTERKMRNM